MSLNPWRKKETEAPLTGAAAEFARVMSHLNGLLLPNYILDPLRKQRASVIKFAEKYGYEKFLPVVPRWYCSLPDQMNWLMQNKKPPNLEHFEPFGFGTNERPLRPYFIFDPAWLSRPQEDPGDVGDSLVADDRIPLNAEEGIIFILDELKQKKLAREPRPLRLNLSTFHLLGDRVKNNWFEIKFDSSVPTLGLKVRLASAHSNPIVLHAREAKCFLPA